MKDSDGRRTRRGCHTLGWRHSVIPRPWAGLALLRAAALLCSVAACGCASDESLAREQQGMVRPGMSKDEVRHSIGEPHHVVNDALTQWRDEWVYVYGVPPGSGSSSPDYLAAFRGIAYFFGYCGTIAAAVVRGHDLRFGGSPDSESGSRGGRSSTRIWRFSVLFSAEGRVSEIEDVW